MCLSSREEAALVRLLPYVSARTATRALRDVHSLPASGDRVLGRRSGQLEELGVGRLLAVDAELLRDRVPLPGRVVQSRLRGLARVDRGHRPVERVRVV